MLGGPTIITNSAIIRSSHCLTIMSSILAPNAFNGHPVGHATCQSASPFFNPDKPSFYMITAFCTIAILLLLVAVLSLLLIQLRALSKQLSFQCTTSLPRRSLCSQRYPDSQHRRSLSCIRVVSFHITVQRSHSSMSTPPPWFTSSPPSPPQKRSRDQGMKTSDLLAPSDRPPPRLYARSDWPLPRLCSQ